MQFGIPNFIRTVAVVAAVLGASCVSTVTWGQQTSASSSGTTSKPVVVTTMPPIPPHGGSWLPDPTLQSKLDKSYDAGDYTLNPPLGFVRIEKDSPDGAGRVWNWSQPARANGSQPNLSLAVAKAPKGDEHKYNAGDILAIFVESIRQNRLRWSACPSEVSDTYKVNGQPFVRLYYNVIDDAKGFSSRGFVYATEPTPGTFIIINGEDADPYSDTTFPILEDAALSLRPKGVAAPTGVPK